MMRCFGISARDEFNEREGCAGPPVRIHCGVRNLSQLGKSTTTTAVVTGLLTAGGVVDGGLWCGVLV